MNPVTISRNLGVDGAIWIRFNPSDGLVHMFDEVRPMPTEWGWGYGLNTALE